MIKYKMYKSNIISDKVRKIFTSHYTDVLEMIYFIKEDEEIKNKLDRDFVINDYLKMISENVTYELIHHTWTKS